MSRLTLWQRIRRRIALMGGSYTHPDGSIELDFEAAAGVDHYRDSEEVAEAKVERHWAKEARWTRIAGALSVGMGVYMLTRPDADTWRLAGGVMLIAVGLCQVSRN